VLILKAVSLSQQHQLSAEAASASLASAEQKPAKPAPFIVQWHRPDPRKQIYRIWGLGVMLIMLGLVCASLALAAGQFLGTNFRIALALIGASCTIAGPLSSVIRLLREMRDDTYLALQSNGLLVVDEGDATFVCWRELKLALVKQERGDGAFLEIECHEGEPIEVHQQFSDISLSELCKRINHVRTKALMGMLRPNPRKGKPYLSN
jgi:hypothetical protein